MRVRTKSFEADAVEVTHDMQMGEANELGLEWDEYGNICGRRGLYATAGNSKFPVPVGWYVVTYENGLTRIFPDEGFREIFEEASDE